jgi:hypothetical protein
LPSVLKPRIPELDLIEIDKFLNDRAKRSFLLTNFYFAITVRIAIAFSAFVRSITIFNNLQAVAFSAKHPVREFIDRAITDNFVRSVSLTLLARAWRRPP